MRFVLAIAASVAILGCGQSEESAGAIDDLATVEVESWRSDDQNCFRLTFDAPGSRPREQCVTSEDGLTVQLIAGIDAPAAWRSGERLSLFLVGDGVEVSSVVQAGTPVVWRQDVRLLTIAGDEVLNVQATVAFRLAGQAWRCDVGGLGFECALDS